jgi:cell division protein FtsN
MNGGDDEGVTQIVINKPENKAEAKPEAKPEAKADAKQETKPAPIKSASADVAADKPKKSEAAPESKDPIKDIALKSQSKSESAGDAWTYFLQAGAFNAQGDAEAARAKLALSGVEAQISEKPSPNGVLYRVRIGPFAQLETANRVRGKLSDNGVDVAVVRVAK